MPSVTVRAFAKINLSLRIKDVRPDGFHDVQTILQTVDLADRLVCERRRGPVAIACSSPGVPTDRTNLVWRAAQRLWNAAGRDGPPRDVQIVLDKRIPMQAGLGGGSSDAAAALLALRALWKMDVPDSQLVAIAARLGSDVPYFFVGGTALGLGRGEDIYRLEELPPLWVVLVFPPFGVATADAYAWLDEQRARTSAPAVAGFLPGTWLGRTVPLVNDLERPVAARHPVLRTLKARLVRMGATLAAMSGSGSTVFGVFTTKRAAAAAARRLAQSGAAVSVSRFLGRPVASSSRPGSLPVRPSIV